MPVLIIRLGCFESLDLFPDLLDLRLDEAAVLSFCTQGPDLLGSFLTLGLELLFGGLCLAAVFVASQNLVNQVRRTIVAERQALPDGVGVLADGTDIDHGNVGGIRTVETVDFTRKL